MVAIFIDGGNFYRKIRKDKVIPKGTMFDYIKFADFLSRGREIILKSYYIGIVRNHDNSAKSQKMVESQQKFLAGLENNGYEIKKGKIVYDNDIREKGIDVQIAIDLVIGAVENKYDVAIIVSSDTDLIPAIKYIRSKGKIVEYVGFSNAPSLGMIKESNDRILLLKEQLETFKNVNIKKISSDNWKKFKAIRLAGFKSDPQAFGGDMTEELNRKEPEWRKRLDSKDRFFFAVEENGIFVSVAGAKNIGDKLWMLMAVYTLPEYRNKGFAKILTKKIVQESKNIGAIAIQLMVNIDQKDAVHIYEKAGFKILKTLEAEKMADGKLHDEYLMEKRLINCSV